MKPRIGQMGPFYSLYAPDDLNLILDKKGVREAVERLVSGKIETFEEMDKLLAIPLVRNLIGELHRRMNRRTVEDPSTLFNPQAFLVYGPKSIVTGLQEAAKVGMADNYTYHFAATALFLYRQLALHGLLADVMKHRDEPGSYAAVPEYARMLTAPQQADPTG